jgi:hypothetical protein
MAPLATQAAPERLALLDGLDRLALLALLVRVVVAVIKVVTAVGAQCRLLKIVTRFLLVILLRVVRIS